MIFLYHYKSFYLNTNQQYKCRSCKRQSNAKYLFLSTVKPSYICVRFNLVRAYFCSVLSLNQSHICMGLTSLPMHSYFSGIQFYTAILYLWMIQFYTHMPYLFVIKFYTDIQFLWFKFYIDILCLGGIQFYIQLSNLYARLC